MENKDQPAFPQSPDTEYCSVGPEGTGLTEREYFAGLAMQGYIAHCGNYVGFNIHKQAVKDADALLAELEKGGAG